MGMVEIIVIWAAIAVASAVVAGILAGIKNRDYSFWIAWGFLFPPSVIILIFLPRHKGPRPKRPPLDDLYREDSLP